MRSINSFSELRAEAEAVVGHEGTVHAAEGVLTFEPTPLAPDSWPLASVRAHVIDRNTGRRVVRVGELCQQDVLDGVPVRRPAEYHGQRNHPGLFWSRLEQTHLVYESRHELSRLLLAECDAGTRAIRTQPLTFAGSGSSGLPLTPDILLATSQGTRLIEVKTVVQLRKPRIILKLHATRALADELGWSYEVFLAMEPQVLTNLLFLHAYQDASRISATALKSVSTAASCLTSPISLRDLESAVSATDGDTRAAVLHLIRMHKLHANLGQPLDLEAQLSWTG